MNRKIDIIIPAYKAQDTILRTLCSIATQTILSDIEVTIVNDCCPNGDYQEFVNMFKKYFPIREIKLDKNGGPGVARQKGIDETHNDYFAFIDADDTFTDAMAIETLRDAIEDTYENEDGEILENVYQCVNSIFMQLEKSDEHKKQKKVKHRNDMIWVFGKIYRRSFIEKYSIRFSNTRANEDTGFNTLIRLLCDNEKEQLREISKVTYFWHYREDSITRINQNQYHFDQCIVGYVDNMVKSISTAVKIRNLTEKIICDISDRLLYLYVEYMCAYGEQSEFIDQIWEYCKKYYYYCYQPYKNGIPKEFISEKRLNSVYNLNFKPIMPLQEFLAKLDEEKYNPEDIKKILKTIPKELKDNNVKCGVCDKAFYSES